MHHEPKYLYLLLSLLTAIALTTSATPRSLFSILGVLIAALSLVVTAYLLTDRRQYWLLTLLLGAAASLPFVWASLYLETLDPRVAMGFYVLNLGCWLLFTCYSGLLIFRSLLTARRIGSNTIYRAIVVYLLIGILFAEVFQGLLVWQPGALYFDPSRFSGPQVIGGRLAIHSTGDILYYSFVTLGTVGYGDVTPSSPVARAVSLLEAVTGIMYVATMIARFVAIQISSESYGGDP